MRRNDVGSLQSDTPALVTDRYRKVTVVAGVSPDIVVVDLTVEGAGCHVCPPSALQAQSYDARSPAVGATTLIEPDTAPWVIANTRGG